MIIGGGLAGTLLAKTLSRQFRYCTILIDEKERFELSAPLTALAWEQDLEKVKKIVERWCAPFDQLFYNPATAVLHDRVFKVPLPKLSNFSCPLQ